MATATATTTATTAERETELESKAAIYCQQMPPPRTARIRGTSTTASKTRKPHRLSSDMGFILQHMAKGVRQALRQTMPLYPSMKKIRTARPAA